MVKPRVILDTNILISGLVFTNGKIHKILRLVENGEISLVIPDPIMMRPKKFCKLNFLALKDY